MVVILHLLLLAWFEDGYEGTTEATKGSKEMEGTYPFIDLGYKHTYRDFKGSPGIPPC